MRGYIANIEKETGENKYFRKTLYTAKHCQLVVMSLKPGEDIGEEVHHLDQFFRFEKGTGTVMLDDAAHKVNGKTAVIVPAGTKHNIINTGKTALKLYTLYSPPNHRDGTIHKTKADALLDKEHFDGKTSE